MLSCSQAVRNLGVSAFHRQLCCSVCPCGHLETMSAHPLSSTSYAGEYQPRVQGVSAALPHGGGTGIRSQPICPLCGRSESTIRVDALHTSGMGLPDSARAELIEHSAPPAVRAVPVKTPTYGSAVALFATGGAALALAGWMLAPWSRDLPLLLRFGVGPALALYVGALAGAALLMLIKRPQMTKAVAEYVERIRAYEAESARQQQAFLIWSRLFYCAHDNVVFLPGSNEIGPLEDTVDFCYRLAERA